jgi:lactoylglutathione lyase
MKEHRFGKGEKAKSRGINDFHRDSSPPAGAQNDRSENNNLESTTNDTIKKLIETGKERRLNTKSRIEDAQDPLFRKLDCYSLPVDNLDSAIAFYGRLGHQLIWREGTHAAGLRLPDSEAEIVLHTDHRPIQTYFLVESVPQAIERIQNAGGKLETGPFEIQVGLYAMLRDPWNNPLVILDFSKGILETDAEANVIGNRDPD